MFSHGFPYTNFHDLNLDWIIKTVKILFNKSVFSINNIEPDDDGNVTITGAELGAIGTVNNIAPVDGNVTLTASDVGAVAQGVGVTKVNGFGPDSSGNVLSGTVRSINGISPASLPTPGNVVLNASDVGALPSTIDPVETVNGISPDAQGNVNVGTVKSVNGSTPDAQGNVNLPTVAGVTSVNGIGPDAQGNVQIAVGAVNTVNNIAPTNGNVALTASDVGAMSSDVTSGNGVLSSGWTAGSTNWIKIGRLVYAKIITLKNETGSTASGNTVIATGFPVPDSRISDAIFLARKNNNSSDPQTTIILRIGSDGNLKFNFAGAMNNNDVVDGFVLYFT